MIPLRLVLRDFLSYVDPEPVDFTGFDIACLSGDNGAGKSALLDAITFALFGAARGCEGGQNQDRLIRDGAEETLVDFVFELEDETYRIARRRTRSKGGELRFLIADGDEWRNAAGDTLRETEDRISSLLRVDYRTFTASAFFLQGRAEDFLARMRPDERKDVFVGLLDLGAYETLEAAGRERSRDAGRRRDDHGARAAALSSAPDALAALERELAELTAAATATERSLRQSEAEAETARGDVTKLEREAELLERDRRALAETQERLGELRAAEERKCRELAEIDARIAEAPRVREAVAEIEQLRNEDHRLRERQAEAAELDRRRAELASRIDAERDRHLRAGADAAARAKQLRKELTALATTERKLAKVGAALDAASGVVDAFQAITEQLRTQSADEARLQQELAGLGERAEDLDGRLRVLEQGGGSCPVCGAPLDDAHRRRAQHDLESERRTVRRALDRARSDLETTRKEAVRLAEERQRAERALTEREELIGSRDALAARLERRPELEAALTALETELREAERLIEAETYAADARKELERVLEKTTGLYDATEHQRVLVRLEELRPFERLAGAIEEAERSRPAVVSEAAQLGRQVAELAGRIDEERARLAVLEGAVAGVADARARLESIMARAADLGRQLRTEQAQGAARAERVERARADVDELIAEGAAERAAATEHRRYRRLAEAFGRGGVPDRIIENVLPALREEANTIVGRLTDYEMSVDFLMERATKQGKLRETFDVLVHQSGGQARDFAMFSGGEAFRIAFAVRLALSKLLVRRAGAQISTLVIDEGFGTQDPEGRQRLVEAVNLAREEFGKVLVITHLDDLKDLFGAQIRVTKDEARGSLLDVVPA